MRVRLTNPQSLEGRSQTSPTHIRRAVDHRLRPTARHRVPQARALLYPSAKSTAWRGRLDLFRGRGQRGSVHQARAISLERHVAGLRLLRSERARQHEAASCRREASARQRPHHLRDLLRDQKLARTRPRATVRDVGHPPTPAHKERGIWVGVKSSHIESSAS